MSKYLDSNGLLYFWQKLKTLLAGKVDTVTGKGLSTNDYTTDEKTKLAGIAAGANAYTHPTSAGNKHIPTGGASGQILRWDASGTAVWGADQDTTYGEATTSVAGLMAAADKTKLDGVAAGANAYTHPSHTAKTSGLYKVTVDAQGHVSAATAAAKADITGLGIPGQDTTYGEATTSVAGLMAAADKTKLDGVAAGANNYVHPTTAGNKHIPTGGSSGQILRWDSSGTAVWGADTDTVYTHPTATAKASGLYKITVDGTGHVSAAAAVAKSDITGLGIPAQDTTYGAATGSVTGLMSAADKTKLDLFGAASTYALKSDITSLYKHKGSVAAVGNLPTEGNTAGDVYNVTASGMNYVWTGSEWDALGGVFSLESITNAEIDTVVAS